MQSFDTKKMVRNRYRKGYASPLEVGGEQLTPSDLVSMKFAEAQRMYGKQFAASGDGDWTSPFTDAILDGYDPTRGHVLVVYYLELEIVTYVHPANIEDVRRDPEATSTMDKLNQTQEVQVADSSPPATPNSSPGSPYSEKVSLQEFLASSEKGNTFVIVCHTTVDGRHTYNYLAHDEAQHAESDESIERYRLEIMYFLKIFLRRFPNIIPEDMLPKEKGVRSQYELVVFIDNTHLDGYDLPDFYMGLAILVLQQNMHQMRPWLPQAIEDQRLLEGLEYDSYSPQSPSDSEEGPSKAEKSSPQPPQEEGEPSGGCSAPRRAPRRVSWAADLPPMPAKGPDRDQRARCKPTRYANQQAGSRDALKAQTAAATVYSDNKSIGDIVAGNTKKNAGNTKKNEDIKVPDSADEKEATRKGKRQREETKFYSQEQGEAILSEEASSSKRHKRQCGRCLGPGHDMRNCPYNKSDTANETPPPKSESGRQKQKANVVSPRDSGDEAPKARASFQDLATAILESAAQGKGDRGGAEAGAKRPRDGGGAEAGAKRAKRKYACRTCGENDHNSRTCPHKA